MMVVTELVMIEQAAVVVLPVFRCCFVVLRVQVKSDMRCEISGEGFGAGRGAEDINPRRAFRWRENWFFSLAQREKKEAARFVKGNDPPRTERFPATFTCNRATFTASHPFNRDRTGYAVWIDETGNGASEARAKEGDSEARLARKKGKGRGKKLFDAPRRWKKACDRTISQRPPRSPRLEPEQNSNSPAVHV